MKNNVKKFLILLLSLLCVMTFAFACDGCNNGEQEENKEQQKITVNLEHYAYTIDIYEEYTFVAKTNGKQEEIVWSSSVTSVATVDGGKVTPVAVGETIISAKIGDVEAKCYLTVENRQMLPLLSTKVYNEELRLMASDDYPLTPTLTYGNVNCEGATFSFVSENPSVATVDENGLVKAVAGGKTRVKITANWKNVEKDYITAYVTVLVVGDVTVTFNQDKVSLHAVTSFGGQNYETSAPLTCTVYKGGTAMSGQPVQITVADDTVCSYTEGEVTALKAGKTLINATTTVDGIEYKGTAEVEVLYAYTQSNTPIIVGKNSTYVGYLAGEGETITALEANIGGEVVKMGVTDDFSSTLSNLQVGETAITVYNDKTACVYNDAEVIDLYINHPEEVEILRSASFEYVLLGNDIDMSEYPLTTAYTTTFAGIFDGDGHKISGLQYNAKEVSLFYKLAGTVKDLILEASIGGIQSGAVCYTLSRGTIDNVYAKMSMGGRTNMSGGFTRYIDANTENKIVNSFVNVTKLGDDAESMPTNGLIFGFAEATSVVDITNTYAIKPFESANIVGNREEGYATFRDEFNSKTGVAFMAADFFNALGAGSITINQEYFNKINDWNMIYDADDFAGMFSMPYPDVRYKKFILMTDIDMDDLTGGNAAITPIPVFSGTLDGNGHSVENLIIGYGNSNGSAMFREMNEGTVKNIALKGVSFDAAVNDKIHAAAIAGGMRAGSIDNVFVSIDVSAGGNSSAGLVGWLNANEDGDAARITNSVVVTTTDTRHPNTTKGAIVGKANAGTMLVLDGTYAIVYDNTIKLLGEAGDNDALENTINANSAYTLTQFNDANIDFSGYNVAVRNNVTNIEYVHKDGWTRIATADEFAAIFSDAKARYKKYLLVADIDMNNLTGGNKSITPLGVFSGTFDGDGYTVSNITFSYSSALGGGSGMFNNLNEGSVINLALDGVKFDSTVGGKSAIGAIAAGARAATIENVFVNVALGNLGANCGALVGYINNSTTATKINNCVAVATHNADVVQASLVGKVFETANLEITNSYAVVPNASVPNVVATGTNATLESAINALNINYTLEGFNSANIDFSAYNKAVKDNVSGIAFIYNDGKTRISTATEFLAIRTPAVNSNSYILTNDIDLQGITVAGDASRFGGIIDGNGYAIKNLNLSGFTNGYGLGFFREINGNAVIKNIAFTNVTFSPVPPANKTAVNLGVIAAGIWSGSLTLDNVFISVDLSTSEGMSAPIVGWAYHALNVNNSVIVLNSALLHTSDGLITSIAGNGSTYAANVTITNSYVIKKAETEKLIGDTAGKNDAERDEVNGIDTGATKVSYLLDDFKTANIDFSEYNKAVKDNVAFLLNA